MNEIIIDKNPHLLGKKQILLFQNKMRSEPQINFVLKKITHGEN